MGASDFVPSMNAFQFTPEAESWSDPGEQIVVEKPISVKPQPPATTTATTAQAQLTKERKSEVAKDAIRKKETIAPVEDLKQEEDEFYDEEVTEHLNVIFIGHVDAGKSTMGGHLL